MSARNRYLIWGTLVLSLLVGPGVSSMAQGAPEETLRVARIAHVEGEVTMQRTFDEDWVEATINTPLMEGDKLYTGVDARAEIELEDEVVIRLDEESFIHFEALDPARTRVGIVQGTVAFNARPVEYLRPWVAINTPSATAFIVEHAKVRVEVEERGSTEFRVRRGRIEIETGPDSIRRVERGQRLLVHGPEVFMVVPGVEEDEFDLWCDLRDARSATSVSPEYVSTRVSGYSELDRYGSWIEVNDYGRVWQPRVTVVDWAPYRYGRWNWRNRCGWVWVSDEPWGWVPYHYGRWVYLDRHRWCWVPHEVVVMRRPVWHPALVSFTYSDSGSYFSLTIGGGYYRGPCVGWFPLGPRDPYYGWYWHDTHRHRWHHYRDRHHRYQNQHVAKAVSVVPREDFGLNRYDRYHGSTLKLADADHVRVGARAREELQSTVFKAPSEKPGNLRRSSAPRVASQRVRKREVQQREVLQASAKPEGREKPGLSRREVPHVPRSAKPGVPSGPKTEIISGREPNRRRQPSVLSQPREPAVGSSEDKPRSERSRQPSMKVRRESVEVYRRDTSPPGIRYSPPKVETSRPSYSSRKPRSYRERSVTEDVARDNDKPYQYRARTYEAPPSKPEPKPRSSSSYRRSSSPRTRSVQPPPPAPRKNVSRAPSPARSTRPARSSSPSVQKPSAPASRGQSARPAPASKPAPSSRRSRGGK